MNFSVRSSAHHLQTVAIDPSQTVRECVAAVPHHSLNAAVKLRPVKVILERLTSEKIEAIQKSCKLTNT